MAVLQCRSCQASISDTATECPRCGDKYPHGATAALAQTAAPGIGIILGILLLLAFLSHGC